MDINLTLLIPIIILQLILQILALVDLFRQADIDKNKKTIWVVVILLSGILGPIFYFIIERREK